MQLVMCRSCGHFQPGVQSDGSLEPIGDECEECDSRTFVDVDAAE